MRLVLKGLAVASVLAIGVALILPEPLAIIVCGPLYKYCGWLCC